MNKKEMQKFAIKYVICRYNNIHTHTDLLSDNYTNFKIHTHTYVRLPFHLLSFIYFCFKLFLTTFFLFLHLLTSFLYFNKHFYLLYFQLITFYIRTYIYTGIPKPDNILRIKTNLNITINNIMYEFTYNLVILIYLLHIYVCIFQVRFLLTLSIIIYNVI